MSNLLTVRALKIVQGENTQLYSFFLRGGDILKISDISRIRKDEEGSLLGYQRGEVLKHVNEIAEYLGTKNVIFPNAIILAISRGCSPSYKPSTFHIASENN